MSEEDKVTDISAPSNQLEFIPGFELLRVLGRGGMGEVYLARQTDGLDREVAIKTILSSRSEDYFRRRFLQEGQRQADLHHPHILPIFAAGEVGNTLYLVTHFARDGSLRDKMSGGALTPEAAVSVMTQVLSALHHAHTELEKPLVHLDIKPDNILFDGDNALLSDFGIARKLEREAAPGTVVAGDPRYWAPEQQVNAATSRSDMFALGTTFYEMLSGKRPAAAFRINTGPESARQLVRSLPRASHRYGPLIASCLLEEPMQRPSAEQALKILKELEKPSSLPWKLGTWGAVALAVLVLGASPSVRTTLENGWRQAFPLPLQDVTFQLDPVEARLWVDGTERTFRQLSLAEGPHRIAVVADSFVGEFREVAVGSGAKRFDFSLERVPALTDGDYLEFSRSFGASQPTADRIWLEPTLAKLVLLDELATDDVDRFEAEIDALGWLAEAGDAVAATSLFYAAFEGLPVPGAPADYVAGLNNASVAGYALASLLQVLFVMQELLDAGETFNNNPQAFTKVQSLLQRTVQQGLPQTAALAAASAGVPISPTE